jgi:hypothetical protein
MKPKFHINQKEKKKKKKCKILVPVLHGLSALIRALKQTPMKTNSYPLIFLPADHKNKFGSELSCIKLGKNQT